MTTTTMILTSFPERLLGITDETLIVLIVLLFGTTMLGFMLYIQQRIAWYQAEAEGCINISAVTIRNGVMRVHPVRTRNLRDVMLSPHERLLVRAAAKKTVPNDPSLRFKNHRDELLVYDSAGKAIYDIYGTETLAAFVHGNDERSEVLYFDLICERSAKDRRTGTVDLVIVRRSDLHAEFPDTVGIRPEDPDRTSLLVHMGRVYQQDVLRKEWPEHKTLKLPRA